jgi:hypothetical protein
MIKLTVEKVEQPEDRYVPYVTLDVTATNEDGRDGVVGDVVMSEFTFQHLAGRDPVVGDVYTVEFKKIHEQGAAMPRSNNSGGMPPDPWDQPRVGGQ